jgi:hypothetical protein
VAKLNEIRTLNDLAQLDEPGWVSLGSDFKRAAASDRREMFVRLNGPFRAKTRDIPLQAFNRAADLATLEVRRCLGFRPSSSESSKPSVIQAAMLMVTLKAHGQLREDQLAVYQRYKDLSLGL